MTLDLCHELIRVKLGMYSIWKGEFGDEKIDFIVLIFKELFFCRVLEVRKEQPVVRIGVSKAYLHFQ